MVLEFGRDIFLPLGEAGGRIFDDTKYWRDDNNRTLSDRLWLAKQSDRAAIDRILREAIVAGDDPLLAAERLERYLTPLGQKTTTLLPRAASGRDDAKGNYAARRLARTEVTRAFGQATIQAAELNPFVVGVKWNLSARHPKPDACDRNARGHSRGLEPGVYHPNDAPRYPNHPMDLCFLSPVTVEDTDAVIAQLRRDFDLDPEASRRGDIPAAAQRRESVLTLFRVAAQSFRALRAVVTEAA